MTHILPTALDLDHFFAPLEQLIERFWSKVDKNGPEPPIAGWTRGPCWLWIGTTHERDSEHSYGHFSVGGSVGYVYPHRFAYELANGPLGDLQACHHCDVRLCVRPEHLFAGTQTDNNKDMVAKGRHRNGADIVFPLCRAGLHVMDVSARSNGTNKDGTPKRACAFCRNALARERYRTQREAQGFRPVRYFPTREERELHV